MQKKAGNWHASEKHDVPNWEKILLEKRDGAGSLNYPLEIHKWFSAKFERLPVIVV